MALPRKVRIEIEYDGTAKKQTASSESDDGFSIEGAASSASSSLYAAVHYYTVVRGDCLWNISKRFLGSGTKYIEIYDANVDVIESTAKAHGKPNASKGATKGWWIWPGEVLKIQTEEQAKTVDQSSADTSSTEAGDSGNDELGKKMEKQITALTYTDVASGQSDSVSLTMHDIGKEWMGSDMPVKGADIGVKIILINWEDADSFECGTFILDDISFSGRPTTCVLGGVSVPAMDDFKSRAITRTWEKTTIQEIAAQIAQDAGVQLYYDAETIQIAEIEQRNQTNSAFLYSICEKYGLALKVYNHKIVIFDIVTYEEKDSVTTIYENDMVKWSYNTTINGTYTGVALSYTDPDSDDTINATMGTTGRMYTLNAQASSKYDAELQAAAKVNEANRSIETIKVTTKALAGIVASQCVQISDIGEKIDGKYYVDKIEHSIGSNGYTMQMTLHKVQQSIKVTQPVSSPSGGGMYTVVSADTLWGISKKFYGTGTKYNIIYEANMELIEATAKQHGKKSSDNGHWIWAGETLTIPEG